MLPENVDIAKIEVARRASHLQGLRIYLANGVAAGSLDGYGGYACSASGSSDGSSDGLDGHDVAILEPTANQRIVGFYGLSAWRGDCNPVLELGIITAPKGVDLPDEVYDMEELQNTDGGTGPRPSR